MTCQHVTLKKRYKRTASPEMAAFIILLHVVIILFLQHLPFDDVQKRTALCEMEGKESCLLEKIYDAIITIAFFRPRWQEEVFSHMCDLPSEIGCDSANTSPHTFFR